MLDVLAQLVMVWMLLSMSAGWTLGSASHPVKDKRQFGVIAIVGVAEARIICMSVFPSSYLLLPPSPLSLSPGSISIMGAII